MEHSPPATVDMPLAEVDTPALLVDLDAFEANLRLMQQATANLPVQVRTHAKTHKCPTIALAQIAHGAVGVCCQKVSEAEAMVDGGVEDVLISNEVVGAVKLQRVAALAHRSKLSICVDAPEQVTALAAAMRDAAGAHATSATLDVLVEIDVGAKRCGVPPGDAAVQLAGLVNDSPHLRFGRLQAYHGSAQHVREAAARRDLIAQAVGHVDETLHALRSAGLRAEVITGGGTGTYENEAASRVYNELQCGSYVFMDADYARNKRSDGGFFDAYEHALFVLATVISAAVPERAVVDAGLKAFSIDSGMPVPWRLAGAVYHRPSDEHGILDLAQSSARPKRGEKVLLVPGHCDPTVNLHDWYVGVRGFGTAGARVESVWPVAARGAVF